MNSITKKALYSASLVFIILLADQALKLWIKTSFDMYEELYITSWFRLLFVENNGMAFGFEWGNKIFLTIFRIIASLGIVGYIIYCLKKNETCFNYLINVA